MPELRDATVIIGVPGLNGGGITPVQLSAAIAGLAPSTAPYITSTPHAGLSGEFALSTLGTGILKVTTGTGALSVAVGADLPAHNHTGVVAGASYTIDGGGVVLTTGVKGDLYFPMACTITDWFLLPDQSGSVTIAAWRDTYANFPPLVGDLLFTMTLSATTKATASGLSHSIAAGDIIRFNINSVTAVQRVSIGLKFTRSI